MDVAAYGARVPSHSNIADDPSRFHFTQARAREACFCRPQPSLPSCSRSAFLVVRPVSATVMSPKLRQQIPSSDQLLRQLGDRMLRFQRHWLDLVLEELRRDRTTSRCAWMGCGGRVWGRIHIGDAARLSSMEELRATRGPCLSNVSIIRPLQDVREAENDGPSSLSPCVSGWKDSSQYSRFCRRDSVFGFEEEACWSCCPIGRQRS
eukprot:s8951_g1.t1